jgi:hypothetical protein
MNKNRNKTRCGYYTYSYSIRTSGEAVGLSVRDIEVICTLILFICAKVQLFCKHNTYFIFCNKILIQCLFSINKKLLEAGLFQE